MQAPSLIPARWITCRFTCARIVPGYFAKFLNFLRWRAVGFRVSHRADQ
jgi:hypothetical protein